MVKFLIQTIDNQIKHDFAFHLIRAIEYQNWIQNQQAYEYKLSDGVTDSPGYVPIGSLEFVFDFMKHYHNIEETYIRPINVPMALRKEIYLGRNLFISGRDEIPTPKRWFVKSHTRYKKYVGLISNTNTLPCDEYLVSTPVEFDSEWRAFVYQGELVGIHQYLGDLRIFPDMKKVDTMIKAYSPTSPLSYTLDIGCINGGWYVIEVHPFVSCGLYGFSDYKRLPVMMEQGYVHLKKEAEKEIAKSKSIPNEKKECKYKIGDQIKVNSIQHGKKTVKIVGIEEHALITWLFASDYNMYDASKVVKA